MAMKANYLKQLKFLFAMAVVMAYAQSTSAASSKWKLYNDCVKDKGRELDVLIDTCTKAIVGQAGNNNNLALIYMMRGNGYNLKKDYDKALDDYNQSIELDPKRPVAYLNRASAWANKREYEHAMSDINEVLSKHRKSAYAYYTRAKLWLMMENIEQAVKDGVYAARLNPSSPRLLNLSCWTRAIAGIDLEGAWFACAEALKRSRNWAEIYDSRSLVNLRLDKFEDAIKDADQALKIKPKLAGSLFVRGIAKLRIGYKEEGEADLTAAKHLEPDIEERYANWGVTR